MNKDIISTAGENGLTALRFRSLEDFSEVSHAVFTRKGGFSREPYRSLNTSFGVGDNPQHVNDNRRLVKKTLQASNMVFCRQVHGIDVRVVPAPKETSAGQEEAAPVVCDALVSMRPRQFLAIQVADCQPVLVYDPKRKVAANIHSGWRGSVANVIGQTIKVMKDACGSTESNLLAAIGPSLGPCCAEFVNYRSEIPRRYWAYKIANNHFDFWAMSRDQLLDAGLVSDNILTSRLCTRCRTDLFFSYRGEGKTGRFVAVIGLR